MPRRPTDMITLAGGEVEYRYEHRGPGTVVICHGGHLRAGISLGEQRLADAGWSILVPSRPGYGRTPASALSSPEQFADLVAELCAHLGVGRAGHSGNSPRARRDPLATHEHDSEGGPVLVLGMSAGSATALALAARHRDLVDRLVLASALSCLPWPDPVTRLASTIAFHPWLQAMSWGSMHTSLGLTPGLGLRILLGATSTLSPDRVVRDLTAQERAQAVELFRLMDSGAGFANDLAHRHTLALQQAVTQPTLVVASPTDGAVPFRHAQHLAETIENATLWRSPSLSHMIWLGTGAGATEERILEFAQECTSLAH